MAQQNRGNNRGNRGGRQRGGGGRQLCPMCPPGNQKPLPKDRPACFECLPEYTIKVSLASKKGDHQILVRTFKNSKPAGMKFNWADQGTFREETTDNDGKYLLSGVQSTAKEREITFHLIGAEAEDESIKIPGTTKEGTQPPEYELVAIVNKAKTEYQVNITVSRQVKPQPAFGMKALIDILDEGDDVWEAEIPPTGHNIGLPFHRRDRTVKFSVKAIWEDEGGTLIERNPDIHTKSIELPGVNIKLRRRKHTYNPSVSLWENLRETTRATRGE